MEQLEANKEGCDFSKHAQAFSIEISSLDGEMRSFRLRFIYLGQP